MITMVRGMLSNLQSVIFIKILQIAESTSPPSAIPYDSNPAVMLATSLISRVDFIYLGGGHLLLFLLTDVQPFFSWTFSQ